MEIKPWTPDSDKLREAVGRLYCKMKGLNPDDLVYGITNSREWYQWDYVMIHGGKELMEGFLEILNLSYDDAKLLFEGNSVVVSRDPEPALLMSMALRADHGLGCPGYYDQFGGNHKRRVEIAIGDARKMYEEVVGTGFYNKNRKEYYEGLVANGNETDGI